MAWQLCCHAMIQFIVIWWPVIELKQGKFSFEFELWASNWWWNCPHYHIFHNKDTSDINQTKMPYIISCTCWQAVWVTWRKMFAIIWLHFSMDLFIPLQYIFESITFNCLTKFISASFIQHNTKLAITIATKVVTYPCHLFCITIISIEYSLKIM